MNFWKMIVLLETESKTTKHTEERERKKI